MVCYSHFFKNFPKLISIYVGYISFSHLIALVRNSSTMLNRSGESGHSCFVGDQLNFHADFYQALLSMMIDVDFSDSLYQIEEVNFYY